MGQAYNPADADSRTLGDMVDRLINQDLRRPDLLNLGPEYIRDAIRFYSRQPFFFNELSNQQVLPWQAGLHIPQGYTIIDTALVSGMPQPFIFVALTTGTSGTTTPVFDSTIFSPNAQQPIFQPGDPGVTLDNDLYWATVQNWPVSNGDPNLLWTQLSTVPAVGQYVPPIDYVAPYRIELTGANLRYGLYKNSFNILRGYDVIRPAPITTYPTDWAWFQNQLYLWPYPNSFYPLTLNYYTAPFPPQNMTDSNFWTTTAEAMVRNYARGLINLNVLRDQESAQMDFLAADMEFKSQRGQEQSQQAQGGIPPSDEFVA